MKHLYVSGWAESSWLNCSIISLSSLGRDIVVFYLNMNSRGLSRLCVPDVDVAGALEEKLMKVLLLAAIPVHDKPHSGSGNRIPFPH